MEPDLNIKLEGFYREDVANQLGQIVFGIVQAFNEHSTLNLSKLKEIVVSCDFASSLQNATTKYNHESPSSFTKSKQGAAVGQLVSKISPEGLYAEYTLVLAIDFFVELFNEQGEIDCNGDSIKPVMHRLHHELVHVHEKNTLTCLDPSLRINDYEDALMLTAYRAWSEYFANYISSSSAPQEVVEGFLKNLETVLKEIPDEIDTLVWDYKNRLISLDEMYAEVKKRVRLIANSCGYAYGYIDSLDINLNKYFLELTYQMSNSKINEPLESLVKGLKNLMERFEKNEISGYEDFNESSEAIDHIFRSFGLTLEWVNESNLYIHVN